MPDTTLTYALPYPEPTDAVDPPGDIQALAEAVDTQFSNIVTTHLCLLEGQAATTMTSALETAFPFGASSETIKTDASWHSTTVNPSRITPNKAGTYRVVARGVLAFNINTAATSVYVAKNGVIFARSGNIKHYNAPATSSNPLSSNTATNMGELTTYVTMNGSTDYLEVGGTQISIALTSGGSTTQTLNNASSGRSTFIVEYVGP